jgi:hypothetical protein
MNKKYKAASLFKDLTTRGGLASVVMIVLMICMATIFVLATNDRSQDARNEYETALQRCQADMDQQRFVPIIGGGHFDKSRIYPAIVLDGKCGTNGFSEQVSWTGQAVEPSRSAGGTPIRVAALLGNRGHMIRCQRFPDAEGCHFTPVGYPSVWQADRIVKLSHYPGLEIWLSPTPPPRGVRTISFVIAGWPRADGLQRTIDCDTPLDLSAVTRQELESLDLSGHRYPCQVEFDSFTFHGGAARLFTSSDLLPSVEPALRDLQRHLADLVIDD